MALPKKILYGGVLFGKGEKKAIDKVLNKNWWGPAGETYEFEKEIASVLGVNHAVFVNSGSSALDIAIRVLNLPKGSEVIVPATTFPTPVASIIREGLMPVVVDVELGNYFISPEAFQSAITKKTKAVLLVYVAGIVGNLKEIIAIARKNKLIIIEDNCDGLGGTYDGKMLGSFGQVSATSSHAAHIISTGNGGVFFTDNSSYYKAGFSIRNWGRAENISQAKLKYYGFHKDYKRFVYAELGSNYIPLELQAAMGRVQLKRLPAFKKARSKNFTRLEERLLPYKDRLILPFSDPKADCCWYTYPITLNGLDREKVLKALDRAGIEWRPILAGDISKQPAFKQKVSVSGKLTNARKLLSGGFWVSLHPQHPLSVMDYIAETIIKSI